MTRGQRRRQVIRRLILGGMGVLLLFLAFVAGGYFLGRPSLPAAKKNYGEYDIGSPTKQVEIPELDVQLLTVNEYMLRIIETMTVFRLSAAILMRPGNLTMRPISRWWSWSLSCAVNLIWAWMILSATMM